MADEYTATNPQTGETVRWDGRTWAPVGPDSGPGFFGAMGQDISSMLKPLVGAGGVQYENPGRFQSRFAAMPPEQQKAQIAQTRGALQAMPSSDVFNQSGESYRARKRSGQSAARAIGETAYEGAAGANMQAFDEALKQGRIGEALGHLTAPIALYGATKVAERAPNVLLRKPLAGFFDVGVEYEKRALEEHQQAQATAERKYQESLKEEGVSHDSAEAKYRLDLEAARKDLGEKLAKAEKLKSDYRERKAGGPEIERGESASTQRSVAEMKKKGFSGVKGGPVYRRVAAMADQVGMRDVPQLDKDVRVGVNNDWTAFRKAIGDDDPKNPKMVEFSPSQQAIAHAEQEILKGSPENIAIFRNMLREGVSPELENATVFRGTTSALEDILQSKDIAESAKPRLIEQLGLESQFRERAGSGPAPAHSVRLPLDDVRGYVTELWRKELSSRGDLRSALKYVREETENKVVKAAIPKNSLGTYERLKANYAQYMRDFYDSDGPLRKLKDATTSDGRINLMTGAEGQNVIDALNRYARYNPNTPSLAGRVRSLINQVAMSSESMPKIPGREAPPSLPKEPPPTALSKRPGALEPIDVTEQKLKKLDEMAKSWSQARPFQVNPTEYRLRAMIAQRAIGYMLSQPGFREWLVGVKRTPDMGAAFKQALRAAEAEMQRGSQ